MAWTDMETFIRVPRSMEEKRDMKAREIRDNWLGKKYFFGPDSPATREGRNLVSFSRMVSLDNLRDRKSHAKNFCPPRARKKPLVPRVQFRFL